MTQDCGDHRSAAATSRRFHVPIFVVSSQDAWADSKKHWDKFVHTTRQRSIDFPFLHVVGVDAEWVQKRPTAVLQVGSSSGCFLFQLQQCADRASGANQWLPAEVTHLLQDADVVKCGVNLSGDIRRLEREQGITVQSPLELDHVALLLRCGEMGGGQLGLGSLCETILGVSLGKDMSVTLSDWEASTLSDEQIQYAADDAIASALIAEQLYHRYSESAEGTGRLGFRDWVRSTAGPAAVAFKQAHKELSRSQQVQPLTPAARLEARMRRVGLEMPQAVDDPYRVQSLTARIPPVGSNGAVVCPPSYSSVRVLNQEGRYIFSCDVRKADWYKKKRLAVDDEGPTTEGTQVIRLTFDPKVKTKLCMNFQLGTCVVGAHCPYAHGPEELRVLEAEVHHGVDHHGAALPEQSRPRRRDDCCAICMSSSTSIKHAVVPPSLRRFLPAPFHCGVADDFLLLCIQCNPRVRIVYDEHLRKAHREAEAVGGADAIVNLNEVKRVVGYAQILLATHKTDRANVDVPADACAEETKDAAVLALQRVPPHRIEEIRRYVTDHWRCTQLHLLGDLSLGDETHSDGANHPSFLAKLSNVAPGEVRARATVRALVGSDAEKAASFINRWRSVFVENFRPAYIPWEQSAGKPISATLSSVQQQT